MEWVVGFVFILSFGVLVYCGLDAMGSGTVRGKRTLGVG